MPTVNVYLIFMGNCEEAFLFYQSVFGGEFDYVGRFKDMPVEEGSPGIEDDLKDRIIHIGLPISEETKLMGSDTHELWTADHNKGNNFYISVSVDSKEEADRIFYALSEGGKIQMPLDNTFWGAYWGQFEDKFGIQWQVNYDKKDK
ncbi:MAG: VOC family protein [Candidatus Cloacimonetes bacterium]|nr:VOC family protein [Candidatus Cloacimonadota bacterium]